MTIPFQFNIAQEEHSNLHMGSSRYSLQMAMIEAEAPIAFDTGRLSKNTGNKL